MKSQQLVLSRFIESLMEHINVYRPYHVSSGYFHRVVMWPKTCSFPLSGTRSLIEQACTCTKRWRTQGSAGDAAVHNCGQYTWRSSTKRATRWLTDWLYLPLVLQSRNRTVVITIGTCKVHGCCRFATYCCYCSIHLEIIPNTNNRLTLFSRI